LEIVLGFCFYYFHAGVDKVEYIPNSLNIEIIKRKNDYYIKVDVPFFASREVETGLPKKKGTKKTLDFIILFHIMLILPLKAKLIQ